jgi:hypothetical protein
MLQSKNYIIIMHVATVHVMLYSIIAVILRLCMSRRLHGLLYIKINIIATWLHIHFRDNYVNGNYVIM